MAIITENTNNFKIDKSDVNRIYTRGTGPGGQHKNKTESCVILQHRPSGIQVKVDGRNQHRNEDQAWKELETRLKIKDEEKQNEKTKNNRREQIGTGVRGEKRRTYRVKDNLVIDHITNKKTSLKNIFKGKLKKIH